jgi:hypothetical protein
MRKLFLTFALVGGFMLGVAAPAFAADPHFPANPDPNAPTTGQPSQTCQNFSTTNGGTTGPQYPGHASTANGSVFNEAFGSNPGGTGGIQYNAVGAPSQYDVACFQHVANHA